MYKCLGVCVGCVWGGGVCVGVCVWGGGLHARARARACVLGGGFRAPK
jgi:hypothetical protein